MDLEWILMDVVFYIRMCSEEHEANRRIADQQIVQESNWILALLPKSTRKELTETKKSALKGKTRVQIAETCQRAEVNTGIVTATHA